MMGAILKTLSIRWGGVGCKIAYLMTLANAFVLILTGGVLIWGREYPLLVSVSAQQAVLLLVGMALLILLFSQIIASGIIRPIANLNTAIDLLARQNWRSALPVSGQDELSRLTVSVNQMAEVINQREASLSRGNRDLFILHTTGLNLMESLELPELIQKISDRASDLVKADTAMISSIDRGSRELRYLGGAGSKTGLLREMALPLEAGGIFNWLASYGTPILIQDAQSDFRLNSEEMKDLGITTFMAVPLWSSNSMIAVLTAINKKGSDVFDKQDLRMFTVFASLAGAALQNALLYADLKQKIEELNDAQQQLIHSTKLAAVGELATNIAHEINNPLTSVLGYTSHLLKAPGLPDESREKLHMMEQETLRVRKIIRNLLDFSRKRPQVMQVSNLVQPLRDTVALLQGVADRSGVRICEEYPAHGLSVRMNPNELKQVFINIINNALHAMPRGGDLTIRAWKIAGGHAVVEISDTGHGISQEHLGKIFEPFFSTKKSEDGTGLGLSISHRIIQNHGGKIEVSSEQGNGARFTIVLPIQESELVSI